MSALALGFVAMYPALWWFARDLMQWRMFGSEVPFSVAFAVLVLVTPLVLAWRFVRRNDLSEQETSHETSVH